MLKSSGICLHSLTVVACCSGFPKGWDAEHGETTVKECCNDDGGSSCECDAARIVGRWLVPDCGCLLVSCLARKPKSLLERATTAGKSYGHWNKDQRPFGVVVRVVFRTDRRPCTVYFVESQLYTLQPSEGVPYSLPFTFFFRLIQHWGLGLLIFVGLGWLVIHGHFVNLVKHVVFLRWLLL